MKLLIVLFSAFCVYCGYDFAERKYQKEIVHVCVEWEAKVDSASAVHSNLLNLHREHISQCRFEYPRKLNK